MGSSPTVPTKKAGAKIAREQQKRPASKEPTDAILTVPNLITFARLALIPLFVWLALGPKRTGWAFVVGGIAGATDFVDGRVARRYGQVSKLGIALDPLSDRFLIAAAAVILMVRHFAPLWTVVLVLVRDALVLAAIPFVDSKGVERPSVNFIGKSATTGVMWGFGMFIGAHLRTPPIQGMIVFAWICYVPGVILSYLAAASYAKTIFRSLGSASKNSAGG